MDNERLNHSGNFLAYADVVARLAGYSNIIT